MNGFKEKDMAQYKDSFTISEDDKEIFSLLVCYAATWVKKRDIDTQILEAMINTKQEDIQDAYMAAELESELKVQ